MIAACGALGLATVAETGVRGAGVCAVDPLGYRAVRPRRGVDGVGAGVGAGLGERGVMFDARGGSVIGTRANTGRLFVAGCGLTAGLGAGVTGFGVAGLGVVAGGHATATALPGVRAGLETTGTYTGFCGAASGA